MNSRLQGVGRIGGWMLGVLLGLAVLAAAPAVKTAPVTAKTAPVVRATPAPTATQSDTSMTLRAGQSGTEFRSMTVEGEDRVHIDFGRPELALDLDPQDVPGLSRGTAMDVLNRTQPVLSTPLIALSAQERSPYVAKPWLRKFATGLVADSRGQTVASFDGTGDPPKEIAWDGRTKSGAQVTPGLTYSYVFEAHDRAGNKRSFVGQGFDVSAYRSDTPAGAVLAMSGRDLATSESDGTSYGPNSRAGKETPPIFLEVATWLNQSAQVREPIRVAVGARSLDQATTLGNRAVAALSGRVIGDPARIHMVTEVAPDAPEDGVLRIGPWAGSAAPATPPAAPRKK